MNSVHFQLVGTLDQPAIGSIFNAVTAEGTHQLQEVAITQSRLEIPLLFGYDVIHGYRTIFPIPLAESCSWELDRIESNARIAACEAAAEEVHWTFASMVDIARDPRWGRVMEGAGEDTYLGNLIAKARVRGFQGGDDWHRLSPHLQLFNSCFLLYRVIVEDEIAILIIVIVSRKAERGQCEQPRPLSK